ncbi:hypothetical protein AZE42_03276 [Rhizopogon vesiculosus]|uniref:F-box domain-containing protein n=1 Tax=Rhizopogon vesiculosus TaxID=180088 RepID=A0A1J8QEV1_9AGAM|nr:hypothetical protein AZE42_03276 [Rhizopogon vesiculosus]
MSTPVFQPSPFCKLPIEILERIAFQLLNHDPTLSDTIIVPLLQTYDGKNRHHLEAAGLPDFVDDFVRKRLYKDSNGWPQESPINCLALWLLWYTSTEERLKAETPARRNEMIKLVLPLVVVPFRYPSAYAPHNHFAMPLTDNSDGHLKCVLAAHGPFPRYVSGRALTTHFYNHHNFEIGIPLASIAAKLIFFSRCQVTPIDVPIHLPINREHAIQLGFADRIGPTQEDVRELNQHKIVNLISPTSSYDADHDDPITVSPSSMHDNDWYRLTDCIYPMQTSSKLNTRYTYGSATGLWQGRIIIPTDNAFTTIFQGARMHEDFTEQQLSLNAPLLMRLREYHCIDPQDPVPTGGANDGFDDGKLAFYHRGRAHTYEAYRPEIANSHDEETCKGCLFRGTCDMIYREDDVFYAGVDADQVDAATEDDDEQFLVAASSQYGLLIDSILDQKGHAMKEDTDVEGDVTCDCDEEYWVQRKCNGVLDIALVGETDFKHGQAWNHYRYYGRVREWDGLVALMRIPLQSNLMTQEPAMWVFSGYVVGGQNFVGTWRSVDGHDFSILTLESAFAATRREERRL